MTETAKLPPTLAAILEDRHKIVRQVNSLTARLADLEARSVHFAGVWKAGTSYDVNALVVHFGATWISLCPTSGERPGSDGAIWQLTAKSHHR